MSKTATQDLPWTGERYVPQVRGDIALEHLHRYAFASGLSEGKRVLDIACGEGYGSEMLSHSAKSVVGVDIDLATVAHAIKKYRSPKMKFIKGACEKIPLPDKSVDLVVSFETLEHIEDHDKFLGEIERVLDSGGILVISTPEKSAYSDKPKHANPFHKKELYREQFLRLLSQKYGHMIYFEQKVTFGSCLVAPKDQTMGFSSFQLNERIMANSKRNGLKDAVLLPEQYHGNPVGDGRALVTVDWGYDICEHIFYASRLFTHIVHMDDLERGLRAEYLEVLVTTKPKESLPLSKDERQ